MGCWPVKAMNSIIPLDEGMLPLFLFRLPDFDPGWAPVRVEIEAAGRYQNHSEEDAAQGE